MRLDVPVQDLGEGPRLDGQALDRFESGRANLGQGRGYARSARRQNRVQKIAWGVSFAQQSFGQAPFEGALEA
jgi:hypothetical protein